MRRVVAILRSRPARAGGLSRDGIGCNGFAVFHFVPALRVQPSPDPRPFDLRDGVAIGATSTMEVEL